MKTLMSLSITTLMVYGLSSCSMMEDGGTNNYGSYGYDQQVYYPDGTTVINSQNTNSTVVSSPKDSGQVMTKVRTPIPHQQQDKDWVNNQNPMGYTIQVGDDANAASVANKLLQAPKNDHTAQVKYQSGGQTHYKGLYGSYQSMDAAKKAYDALPAEVKAGASVKSWGTVQNSVND